MIAYCFRDGVVRLTERQVPEGAVELFRGPQRNLLRLIADTTNDRQIPGLDTSTEVARDQELLVEYLTHARHKADSLVTVADLTAELLESEVAQ